MDHCEACGFVYADVPVDAIAPTLAGFADRYTLALAGADPHRAARRPAPEVWSALEYTAHVRDVFLIQRDRAVQVQVLDTPDCTPLFRDERVALCRYADQTLGQTVEQLAMAAGLCAQVFGAVGPGAWARRLRYHWPTTAEHDLAWLGRHTVHEGEHHLGDLRRVLAG